MAVFYHILGSGSGSIGNVTLRNGTRIHGYWYGRPCMIASQKVSQQTNPRSVAQMTHRAKFATAVKFFKRATSHFFRFAYEDQRPNESDFNVFMRHNVNGALPMNRYQVLAEQYPAIGQVWQLSQGSMPPLSCTYANDNVFQISFDMSGGSGNADVATFSKAMLSAGYEPGDIVTFVNISSSVKPSDVLKLTSEEVGAAAAVLSSVPQWYIAQFIVDESDTTPLANVNHRGRAGAVQVWNSNPAGFNCVVDANPVVQCCGVVVSRRSSGSRKLLVSTSYLAGNGGWQALVAAVRTDKYNEASLESWSADDSTAILQGSIAG